MPQKCCRHLYLADIPFPGPVRDGPQPPFIFAVFREKPYFQSYAPLPKISFFLNHYAIRTKIASFQYYVNIVLMRVRGLKSNQTLLDWSSYSSCACAMDPYCQRWRHCASFYSCNIFISQFPHIVTLPASDRVEYYVDERG